jgi:hypothetical protein
MFTTANQLIARAHIGVLNGIDAARNRVEEARSREDGFTAVEWAVVAAIVIAGAILIARAIMDKGTTKANSITTE